MERPWGERPGWIGAAIVVAVAGWLVVRPGASTQGALAVTDDAPYRPEPGLSAAEPRTPCTDLGARAAFYTTLLTCQQGTIGRIWDYADPYLRLPREVAGDACTEPGSYARDFTRPIVHRCAADDDGALRWVPDPSWSRPEG